MFRIIRTVSSALILISTTRAVSSIAGCHCCHSFFLFLYEYFNIFFGAVAIIDPRTGRSMWKKEGWTLQNPITPENFAEMAMDFCSRNSFDRPPQAPAAPRSGGAPGAAVTAGAFGAAAARKRPMHEMSEEDQIQAAMRASMQDIGDDDDDENNKMEHAKSDDDDEDSVEGLGSGPSAAGQDSKPAAAAASPENGEKTSTSSSAFIQELLQVEVGDEPTTAASTGVVARLQLRMPDGKRVVRQFMGSNPVKVIYAFVAVCVNTITTLACVCMACVRVAISCFF
jgi:UBX domain-containing protein 7